MVVVVLVVVVTTGASSRRRSGRWPTFGFWSEEKAAPSVLWFWTASEYVPGPPWKATVTSTVFGRPTTTLPIHATGRVKSGTNGEPSSVSIFPS